MLPVDFPPQVLKECREPGLAGGLAATRASSQNQFPYFSFFLLRLQRKHDMKPYLFVSFTQIAAAVSSVYTYSTNKIKESSFLYMTQFWRKWNSKFLDAVVVQILCIIFKRLKYLLPPKLNYQWSFWSCTATVQSFFSVLVSSCRHKRGSMTKFLAAKLGRTPTFIESVRCWDERGRDV